MNVPCSEEPPPDQPASYLKDADDLTNDDDGDGAASNTEQHTPSARSRNRRCLHASEHRECRGRSAGSVPAHRQVRYCLRGAARWRCPSALPEALRLRLLEQISSFHHLSVPEALCGFGNAPRGQRVAVLPSELEPGLLPRLVVQSAWISSAPLRSWRGTAAST